MIVWETSSKKKSEQVFKCCTVEHEDKDTCFYSLTNSKTLGSVQKMTSTLQKSPLQSSSPCKLLPGIGHKVLSRFQEATAEQVMMSYTSDIQRGWENPQKRQTFWGVQTCGELLGKSVFTSSTSICVFFSKDGLPQKLRKGYPGSSYPTSPFTATMTCRASISGIKILPLTFVNEIMLKNTSEMPKNGKIPHVDVGAVSLDHYIRFTGGRQK